MSNVVDALPTEYRDIFAEVIGYRDDALLSRLRDSQEPSRDERKSVMRILSREFVYNLREDDEPTDRGTLIDNALGAFLLQWPIEHE